MKTTYSKSIRKEVYKMEVLHKILLSSILFLKTIMPLIQAFFYIFTFIAVVMIEDHLRKLIKKQKNDNL